MAVAENAAAEVGEREEQNNTQCSPVDKKKRTKDPGTRVKGALIYDSENGKICHQGLPASKRSRDKENQGVEQNEAEPKKKEMRAKRSTNGGIAAARPPKVRKLKKGGSDKENELTEADTDDKKGAKMLTSAGRNHGNSNEEKGNAGNTKAEPLSKVGKSKKLAVKAHVGPRREEIVLPQGSPLTEVVGVELPVEDVGAALQFFEFCNAFSEVLGIKKGQPECVIRDLTRGRVKRQRVCSAHVDFSIKLLSLLEQKDMKKDGDEWVQTLKSCIEESECTLEELPLEFLDRGASGYDNLEPSEKLKILNFLCDEVLVTAELRNWIDQVAAQFDERRKERKEKVLAAKKKEKDFKQKVKKKTAKAVLSCTGVLPLTLPEFDRLLSQLRTEADKVHAEVLASLELVPKKNQRSDAVRTDHMILGHNGKIFWKLSGYNNRSHIILQDVGNWDSVTPQDKWFIYNEEEEKVVEKYISSLRNPEPVRHIPGDIEEGMKSGSSVSPGSSDCLPQEEMEA